MAKKVAKKSQRDDPKGPKTSKKVAKPRLAKKTAKKKVAKKKTTKNQPKRLYRAEEKDSMLGGVCAGIAEYTNTDPVLIRLITLILAFFDGIGILAYIIAWIVMPRK